jgi:hypothetical protein
VGSMRALFKVVGDQWRSDGVWRRVGSGKWEVGSVGRGGLFCVQRLGRIVLGIDMV